MLQLLLQHPAFPTMAKTCVEGSASCFFVLEQQPAPSWVLLFRVDNSPLSRRFT